MENQVFIDHFKDQCAKTQGYNTWGEFEPIATKEELIEIINKIAGKMVNG